MWYLTRKHIGHIENIVERSERMPLDQLTYELTRLRWSYEITNSADVYSVAAIYRQRVHARVVPAYGHEPDKDFLEIWGDRSLWSEGKSVQSALSAAAKEVGQVILSWAARPDVAEILEENEEEEISYVESDVL